MKKIILSLLLLSFSSTAALACTGTVTDEYLCETPEIQFSTGEAVSVQGKALSLGSVVNIYEYIRNESKYSVYQGARSNSINTFLSKEGNDVDLASTLISMYRAVGIKARYAVGSVRLKRSDISNWIAVENNALAISILKDQGINVVDETSPDYVTIEHVWVEVLTNFANYRGGNKTPLSCPDEDNQCKWIALDPSFKLRNYNAQYHNLLSGVTFDYTAYYNAETNQTLRNKNPLEIFEESSLKYLRTNNPGRTLEDVIDAGEIIKENLGLLPSSLPYDVIGTIKRYSSLSLHDADSVAKSQWNKNVVVSVTPIVGGLECGGLQFNGTFTVAELSTKKLTVNWGLIDGVTQLAMRLDGVKQGGGLSGNFTINCNGASEKITEASHFNIKVKIDASPVGLPIEVKYEGLVVGGYYLVATGGETSNWSQVRRAYENLLAANKQYPIITDASGNVYVDENKSGLVDSGDTLLLQNQVAQDALTGGLLYIAQSLYYTKLKESSNRYSRLKNIVSPIAAYVGIVSTTYEVEKVGETPFAVLPGGLLIDLKGIRINGSWAANAAESYSNETFKFLGHIASSLEHEVWQELTGYDAVSTMRGIQLALKSGASLLSITKSPTDTFEPSLVQMGIGHTAPTGFTKQEYTIFDRNVVAWKYTGTTPAQASFYIFRGNISAYPDPTNYLATSYIYQASNGINEFFSSYDTLENTILATATTKVSAFTCGGTQYSLVRAQALVKVKECFDAVINQNINYINFLDKNKGFNPDTVFYKGIPPLMTIAEHGWDFVSDVRNHLYYADPSVRYNYITPSKLATGPHFVFDVYIQDTVATANSNVVSSSYIIKNESMRLAAGGGYVPEGVPVVPATDTTGVVKAAGTKVNVSGVTFNNEIFTDKNLVAIANNDVVRTPSTVDPVSTVTGNMYHDETDVVIEGKGLPYTFTRTYNANDTSTDGPGSSNTNYFPLSQGWTHSYNMKLVANDYGQYPNYDITLAPENKNSKTSSVTFIDERGGESNYLLDDSSTTSQPSSPKAGFDKLVLNSPSANLHQITYSNGSIYTFDSQGVDIRKPGTVARLYSIQDVNGNKLSFTYTNNKLTAVKDNMALSGRAGLTLSYYAAGVDVGRLQFVTDWSGRKWEYLYTNSQLSSVKNPLGAVMAYTYVPGTHWLKDIIQPEDRNGKQKTMTFSYYENGQAYNYVDKNGSKESLIYDLFRRKTFITNPLGFVTEHSYDSNGALLKIVGADNGIHLFENNLDGLRYTKYNALGQRTRYSYNTSRDLTGVASNTKGLVTREEDALGNLKDYDYGVYGQVTIVKDKNGKSFTNTYYPTTDATTGAVAGKLQKTTAAQATVNGTLRTTALLVEYKYYTDGTLKQKIEYIDPAQATKKRVTDYVYTYASDGSHTSKISVSGSGVSVTTQLSYDTLWRLKSSTVTRRTSAVDATLLSLTTSYGYDLLGRLISTTDPIGNISEIVYDKNGQVKQSIVRYKLLATGNSVLKPQCSLDAAYPNYHSCVIANNTYDAADRLVASTDIMGAVTHYEYDAVGQVTRITNDLGNSLYYEYDAMGHRTKVTDEKGYSVKTKYDLAGNVLEITNPNNQTIKNTYDVLGRPLTLTTPEGRVTKFDSYDANGNLTRLTDANAVVGIQPKNTQNASVYNEFDEFNRTVSTLNAKSEKTRYTYDLLGNRTSVIDALNQTTKFVYDDLGRLTSIIDPIIESGTDKIVSITYDELGNRLTYTDRLSRIIRSTYDQLNRLVKEEYLSDAKTAKIVYDQYGDKVSTDIGGQVYAYTYDAAHRPLTKTDTRKNLTMMWEYNKVGNLINKTTYQGEVQHYIYDKSNRLVSMSAGNPVYIQASYQYDPAGRLLSRILSSGASTLYNYSNDGYLTSMKQISADGTQVDLREYGYDNLGNITKLTINGAEITDYTYDPVYRLLSANSNINTHDLSYTYDAVGNRLTKNSNGTVQQYIYTSAGNRLKEVRQTNATGPLIYSFDYDDNGSMINKKNAAGQQLLHLVYDQRGLASSVTDIAKGNTGFTYDANAYRISKQNGTETKNYYLDGEHLESVYNQKDELQATYLRGVVIDEIINGFEKNASGVMENRTFHHDQVNSVVAVTDHNGKTAQTQSFGPFGESFGSTGTSKNPMQFTGREQDAESGLYYYRARYFDPELGRFISEDSKGFDAGVNFYAYVDNNPVNNLDPMGTNKTTIFLRLMEKWDEAQIKAAVMKAEQLDAKAQEGLAYTNLDGLGPMEQSAKNIFIKDGGAVNTGEDVDHILDRQLGGSFYDPANLQSLDSSVNRSFGSQIYQQIKDLPNGTFITGVTLFMGSVSTMASEITPEDIGGFLIENSIGAFTLGSVQPNLSSVKINSDVFSTYNPGVNSDVFSTYDSGANGGFVIYPNKSNTNMVRAVYKK